VLTSSSFRVRHVPTSFGRKETSCGIRVQLDVTQGKSRTTTPGISAPPRAFGVRAVLGRLDFSDALEAV
jgi:hypothetical protein